MRRLRLAIFVAAAALGSATLAGCPGAHSDYPGASCKVDSDCYKGEKCMNAAVCVPTAVAGDMAMTLPPGSDLANSQSLDLTPGEDL